MPEFSVFGTAPESPLDERDFEFKTFLTASSAAGLTASELPDEVGTINTDYHRQYLPITDQQREGSCHDDETEILTTVGWLPFVDLTSDHEVATVDPANGNLLYERPTRVIEIPWDGDIYTVSNTQYDFRVTGDHQMLVRTWDESARTLRDAYELVPMARLGWYTGLMRSITNLAPSVETYTIPGIPNYKLASQRSDLVVPMRVWLNFLGIYLAEGTMIKPTKRAPYKIQVAAFKSREKNLVRSTLAGLGLKALELRDRFTFENGRIYQHMESLGLKGVYAPEKFVPDFVFALSSDDIEEFLRGHREGDGTCKSNGDWSHSTSSPRLADDLDRLILLAGRRPGRSIRPLRNTTLKDGRTIIGRHPERVIRDNKGGRGGCIVRKNDVRIEQYTGMVYCAEVPTHHTLITRRNGKILISGNCTGHAMRNVKGVNERRLRTPSSRKTVPDFSPRGIYTLGKQVGGYPESEGAYMRDVVKAVCDLGTPREKDWPYVPRLTSAGVPQPIGAPSSRWMQYARPWEIGAYARVRTLDEILAALHTVGPIFMSMGLHENFFDAITDGVVPLPSGAAIGGHAMCLLSASQSRRQFFVANSWGSDWGADGYCAIDFDHLLTLTSSEAWVIPDHMA